MTDEMRDKVARLPAWARQLIRELQEAAAPNHHTIENLHRTISANLKLTQKLKDRIDQMTEILTCAARGGHETCKEYIDRIIADNTTSDE